MKDSSRRLLSFIFGCLALLLIPFITMLFILVYDYSSHSDWIKILVTGILVIVLACIFSFIICMFSPNDVWNIPILVNVGTILTSLGILSNYWSVSDKIILVIVSIIFSYLSGLTGSNIGIRILNK